MRISEQHSAQAGFQADFQADFVAALFASEKNINATFRTWNQSDAMQRFNVYRNNVVLSLIDALAETFSVTQTLVGEDFFRGMARIFVHQNPPRNRILLWYGAAFPDFVATFLPAQTVPYLADVARLEMRAIHAYHAADKLGLEATQWQALCADPQTLETLTLSLHPSVQLLSSPYPVHDIWQAHQLTPNECATTLAALDLSRAQHYMLYRHQMTVMMRLLSTPEIQFLAALETGKPLLHAAQLAQESGDGFDLPPFLSALIQYQLLLLPSS